ncbi:MAG TPA: alpha/beta hydrolase [Egibacteraceae bacterium]|nr:alpha/beta hydrolase [Egibacteraceae bacterium]
MSRSKPLGLLLAASLLLTACGLTQPAPEALPAEEEATVDPTEPPEEPLESTLVWTPCEEPFECSTLPVPRDYGQPDGPTVTLALIRLPAPAAARRIGSLVVNPGGPGGSGVDFVRQAGVETFPAELRARFDIVGFDPRGVAASEGIACDQEAVARFAGTLTSGVADVLAAAQRFAAGCAAHGGELLPHVATPNVAADLDLLREALGDRRLTYLGYSYGTLIGAMYAERYPDKVRAIVLDGAVDPAQDVVARARDKAAATEVALQDFLQWCRDEECSMSAVGEPSMVWAAVLAALQRGSVPAPLLGAGRSMNRGEAMFTTSALLADRADGWPLLAEALAMVAGDHDASLLLGMFDALSGRDAEAEELSGFEFGQLMAVNCLDLPAPPAEEYPRLLAEMEGVSPLFGAVTLLSWAPCSYWPVPPVRQAAPIHAPGSPPLVVIGTRNDGVTPYAWSEALAGQLDNAVLFTRDGDTHTAFGGANVCTDRAIMGYLLEEQPPEAGKSCG